MAHVFWKLNREGMVTVDAPKSQISPDGHPKVSVSFDGLLGKTFYGHSAMKHMKLRGFPLPRFIPEGYHRVSHGITVSPDNHVVAFYNIEHLGTHLPTQGWNVRRSEKPGGKASLRQS